MSVKDYREDFITAYIECALWSSTDESDPETGGDPIDENYDESDLTPEARAQLEKDCNDFIDAHVDLLDESGLSPEQCGHDFWLTRCGHGTGFWDRGLGEIGDKLTKAAKVWGDCNLLVTNDGHIEIL